MLEAAEAVCTEDGIDGPEILDLLTRLVDTSLMMVEYRQEARYRLLETVREYYRDKLDESGENCGHRARTSRLEQVAWPGVRETAGGRKRFANKARPCTGS